MRAIRQTSCFMCIFLGLISAFAVGVIFGETIIIKQPPALTCYLVR